MKEAKHERINPAGFYFYEVPGGVRFIETESRMVAAKAGGRGRGRECSIGTELQFSKMKRALEMDGGNGRTL